MVGSSKDEPAVPQASSYPLAVRTGEERRRWDLCAAIAHAWFPEEGGPAARFYATEALYRMEIPTDDPKPDDG